MRKKICLFLLSCVMISNLWSADTLAKDKLFDKNNIATVVKNAPKINITNNKIYRKETLSFEISDDKKIKNIKINGSRMYSGRKKAIITVKGYKRYNISVSDYSGNITHKTFKLEKAESKSGYIISNKQHAIDNAALNQRMSFKIKNKKKYIDNLWNNIENEQTNILIRKITDDKKNLPANFEYMRCGVDEIEISFLVTPDMAYYKNLELVIKNNGNYQKISKFHLECNVPEPEVFYKDIKLDEYMGFGNVVLRGTMFTSTEPMYGGDNEEIEIPVTDAVDGKIKLWLTSSMQYFKDIKVDGKSQYKKYLADNRRSYVDIDDYFNLNDKNEKGEFIEINVNDKQKKHTICIEDITGGKWEYVIKLI